MMNKVLELQITKYTTNKNQVKKRDLDYKIKISKNNLHSSIYDLLILIENLDQKAQSVSRLRSLSNAISGTLFDEFMILLKNLNKNAQYVRKNITPGNVEKM